MTLPHILPQKILHERVHFLVDSKQFKAEPIRTYRAWTGEYDRNNNPILRAYAYLIRLPNGHRLLMGAKRYMPLQSEKGAFVSINLDLVKKARDLEVNLMLVIGEEEEQNPLVYRVNPHQALASLNCDSEEQGWLNDFNEQVMLNFPASLLENMDGTRADYSRSRFEAVAEAKE